MVQDDFLTQAADHTMSALKRFQMEPDNEESRAALLLTCSHYLNAGLSINLKPDAVIVKRKEAIRA
jgi:hypothetical protein